MDEPELPVAAAAVPPQPITAHITPQPRFTTPDFADYHIITDDQLTQFERPEAGLLGTIGWAAAGGAAGYVISVWRAIRRALSGLPVLPDDFWSVIFFVLCLVVGIVCLLQHFRMRKDLTGLAAQIRSRQRFIPGQGTPDA